MANNPRPPAAAARVVVLRREAAPIGAPSLLDAVLQETLDRPGRELLESVVRETERQQAIRQAYRRLWTAPATVRGAQAVRAVAAARRVLRFDPRAWLVDQLIQEGLAHWGDTLARAGVRELRQQEGSSDLLLPVPGGELQLPEGWTPEWATGFVAVFNGLEVEGLASRDTRSPSSNALLPNFDNGESLWGTPLNWTFEEFTDPNVMFGTPITTTPVTVGWSPLISGTTRYQSVIVRGPLLTWAPGDPVPSLSEEGVLSIPVAEREKRELGWRAAAERAWSRWPQSWQGGNGPPGPPDQVVSRETDPDEDQWRKVRPPGRPPKLPRRAREKKILFRNYHRWTPVRVMEAITEGVDLVKALFKALPIELQRDVREEYAQDWLRSGRTRPDREPPVGWMAEALYEHWRLIDPAGAVREVAWEFISDVIAAGSGELAATGFNAPGGRSGVSGGTGMFEDDWGARRDALDPLRPTLRREERQWLEELVTDRQERRERQTEAYRRDRAIREGIARRRAIEE